MTRRPPDCRLRVLRLPQPQQSFHLRQTPLFVQLPERRVPRLVQVLQHSLTFLLGCRAWGGGGAPPPPRPAARPGRWALGFMGF
ncbi:hypothetical protein [Nocardia abscessus]|uniref:hypothetical protein n=1 Tax=Nocardia abscessus TaxID=120957 RepID=UPI00245572AC|nr:hypothetical protein [Nocardia abscessus]